MDCLLPITAVRRIKIMLRIGMLTSGGDCQSLNAAMRGVAKALYSARKDVKIIGFEDGYKGLIYGKYREMSDSDFSEVPDSRSNLCVCRMRTDWIKLRL